MFRDLFSCLVRADVFISFLSRVACYHVLIPLCFAFVHVFCVCFFRKGIQLAKMWWEEKPWHAKTILQTD